MRHLQISEDGNDIHDGRDALRTTFDQSPRWHFDNGPAAIAPFIPRLDTLALLAAGGCQMRSAQTDRQGNNTNNSAGNNPPSEAALDCAMEQLALLIEAASALQPNASVDPTAKAPHLDWPNETPLTNRSYAVPEYPLAYDYLSQPHNGKAINLPSGCSGNLSHTGRTTDNNGANPGSPQHLQQQHNPKQMTHPPYLCKDCHCNSSQGLHPPLQLNLSIFIGNIPPNTTPNALMRTVSQHGSVTEIVCSFRPDVWLTAFVSFARPSEAQRAVDSLNNRRALRTPRPHRLVCCFAPGSPASLNCLEEYPPDGESSLMPFTPRYDSSGDMGMMPVPTGAAAAQPRFSLLKDGPPGANLFLYGMPSDWTEVTLLRLCQDFGHVVGLRVPRAASHSNGIMQRLNKGFGFVSYDNAVSSARARAALDGRQFLSKPLNVQLKSGETLPEDALYELRNGGGCNGYGEGPPITPRKTQMPPRHKSHFQNHQHHHQPQNNQASFSATSLCSTNASAPAMYSELIVRGD